MASSPTALHTRLGLFVVAGVGCLFVVLYLLGSKQSLFSRSIAVTADFQNVSGLLAGNNVRLGGITVGTVKDVAILNDSTVHVELRLDRAVQPFVRKNAVASIGTDGLVGNTIINLTAQPGAAPPIAAGDRLRTTAPVGIDRMLSTLDISNRNLVAITQDLRAITGKLNGQNGVWTLLNDEQLTDDVRQSLHNLNATSTHLQTASADVQRLTHGVRQGRGPAGYLLTDTVFASLLGHSARNLARTSDTLAATLTGLQQQVQTGDGPLHTLLADTAFSGQMRQSMQHVEEGTAGFSQSMDALQHNFLLRGYLRRKAKKQARAAGL